MRPSFFVWVIIGISNAVLMSFQYAMKFGSCFGSFSCQDLSVSGWNEILGVPLSYFGLGYFLLLGLTGLFYKKFLFVLKLMSRMGIIISTSLMIIMLVFEQTFCFPCVISFVCSGLLAYEVWLNCQKYNFDSGNKILSICTALALFVASIAGLLWIENVISNVHSPEIKHLPQGRPDPDEMIEGSNPYTEIVLFSDPSCKSCLEAHVFINHFLKKNPGKVQIEEYRLDLPSSRYFAERLGVKNIPTLYLNGKWISIAHLKRKLISSNSGLFF